MSDKLTIYSAGSLFNGRETAFNSQLVEGLEGRGYRTFFSQRDGFEFGNLKRVLSKKNFSRWNVSVEKAVSDIIYLLDVGYFIPNSDVVVANLDEPIDSGVNVELCYSFFMGNYNIGFRTDVRSPYGDTNSLFCGAHPFPLHQCNTLIKHYMPCKTTKEKNESFIKLVDKIDKVINKGRQNYNVSRQIKHHPNIKKIIDAAETLFSGIKDIHSEEGLEEIVNRYLELVKKSPGFSPFKNFFC